MQAELKEKERDKENGSKTDNLEKMESLTNNC